MDNMRIWNKVEKTDPKHTKKFSNGTYKGTAISSIYNAKRATELFGPIGTGWGYEASSPDYFVDAKSETTVVLVRVNVWYELDGKRGEVWQYGATKMAYEAQSRRIVDEDAVKKAVTDGMTKALSLLGFSADVWLGLHDNAAYVRDLQNGGMDTPPTAPPPNKSQALIAKTAAGQYVLRLAGLHNIDPKQWTDQNRAELAEQVSFLCASAKIGNYRRLSDIPDSEIEAFGAAAKIAVECAEDRG